MHFPLFVIQHPYVPRIANSSFPLSPGRSPPQFMQAKTSTVIVRNPEGKPETLNDVSVLMGDLGLFIKSEDKLEMYVWENVLYLEWKDLEAMKTVWEEAIAELLADAFDDDWEDEDDEVISTSEKKEENVSKDDPEVNPFGN